MVEEEEEEWFLVGTVLTGGSEYLRGGAGWWVGLGFMEGPVSIWTICL